MRLSVAMIMCQFKCTYVRFDVIHEQKHLNVRTSLVASPQYNNTHRRKHRCTYWLSQHLILLAVNVCLRGHDMHAHTHIKHIFAYKIKS